jgi:hypothetical protein
MNNQFIILVRTVVKTLAISLLYTFFFIILFCVLHMFMVLLPGLLYLYVYLQILNITYVLLASLQYKFLKSSMIILFWQYIIIAVLLPIIITIISSPYLGCSLE